MISDFFYVFFTVFVFAAETENYRLRVAKMKTLADNTHRAEFHYFFRAVMT